MDGVAIAIIVIVILLILFLIFMGVGSGSGFFGTGMNGVNGGKHHGKHGHGAAVMTSVSKGSGSTYGTDCSTGSPVTIIETVSTKKEDSSST